MRIPRFLVISILSFCILCSFRRPVEAAELTLDVFEREMGSVKKLVESLELTVQSQNEVIQKQNIRIEALEKSGARPAAGTTEPAKAPILQGLSQGFNPDIGVVGTIQTKLTEESSDGEGNDTIALKEIELNIAQYVDPYSRLDAVLSFNDALEAQNTEIEEAYYTHWGLPFGFRGQIGKFRSKIGKQNLLHLDQLPTVDFPLVIQNFFGEEGLASSGARLQNYVPNPWDVPIEVTAEILRGNNGASFSGISRRPIFNTHIKTFFEPTDNTSLELGGTAMFGDENINRLAEGDDRYSVHVFGGDATFLWYLPEGKQLKFQNEVYIQERNDKASINDDPWGFYSLLDFRLSKKFSGGVRFDYVEPLGINDAHYQTTGISPYLTFWQSEFANFRLQYQHLEPASPAAKSDDIVFLEANFLIGSHKHPVQ